MTKRIVIMAGGTGGHVFPALAVAHFLIEQNWQVSWIGTRKGMESRVIPENEIAIDWLSVNGLRGKGPLALFKMPWMLMQACLEARQILRQRKPDVVLGMGGFVAGPGGLMAKMMGIPLVIHEQNRIPGTTNRLLAKVANKVLQAFPESFPASKHAIYTGNPLRKQFTELANKPKQVRSDGLHILVLGGSLGAQRLNEVVPEALAMNDNVEVWHQTGQAMLQQVTQAYTDKAVSAKVEPFIDDVVKAYAWADLVICRAGAMTISEVAAMGVPSILVPYPYAIDDHQTANAQYLVSAGAGIMIAQPKLSVEFLAEQIKQQVEQLDAMSVAASLSAKLDATERVAEQCMLEAAA
ncbi:UDP-N-acetylglucosamine--N-acetylmuramyl-(pentapeptide) pyrophosphoryl-undecaprenol N-acetylglucosamine transferase [Bathymodiolus platifrons methanotrophic gill symbiont]|uniref:undecaprenyldiphospho-muramoylpentapeptide beta-N-acetylglucosaminyltransferase n=1 Tax=Bathymodiolus platifrons methanotrophic gill symbiont TaxID=113268 RepID=UPI000B40F2D0|nr:undecaprenyldiphospho-muramoylpentapeptide beta-N-acetylglucosaminyltransferase [Bathymodiolus platifrons methanotrophic gill symbiont]MCK5869941.1 undecaprenyldiphospho-muramoylpentapeptide beta-N-acetylglucosaminyltransferase [Methyloprofundus sp.]TXK96155.1 undecaprenyldiphospho-muramoylpentapeptide beta-N-acetylglucosaminyltransferase [Methylococcaceae bacterium CS4]TXK97763.1 undecaprenyldiphospho-muramoylpentapeptide beta-N-acetylglucosaminyltransferase [Methylococcaceae bacterium CS5]